MLNQIAVVGRLFNAPTIEKDEKEKDMSNLVIAVPRSYKNANGEYETDFLDVKLSGNIAKNVMDYCKKGDMIAIRGRVETKIDENEKKKTYIVADKVTFLASKPREQEEDKELER